MQLRLVVSLVGFCFLFRLSLALIFRSTPPPLHLMAFCQDSWPRSLTPSWLAPPFVVTGLSCLSAAAMNLLLCLFFRNPFALGKRKRQPECFVLNKLMIKREQSAESRQQRREYLTCRSLRYETRRAAAGRLLISFTWWKRLLSPALVCGFGGCLFFYRAAPLRKENVRVRSRFSVFILLCFRYVFFRLLSLNWDSFKFITLLWQIER